MRRWTILENGIHIVFQEEENKDFKLLHFHAQPLREEDLVAERIPEAFSFPGLSLAGYDKPYERHGNKMIALSPGYRMKLVDFQDTQNAEGRFLKIRTRDEATDVIVDSFWQFYDGISMVRMWHTVRNEGKECQTVEAMPCFTYTGIEKEGEGRSDEKLSIYLPHNSWMRELNWKKHSFAQLGMETVMRENIRRSSGIIRVSNTGNWSTKEYLPMAYIENEKSHTGLFFQIEHNGSWHWEISDQNGHNYLTLGGPNEVYSHWFCELKPGEEFTTVPSAVGVTEKGLDDAFGTLTRYRRKIRRISKDNEKLPVIFNDYMNCLFGHPTAEEEFPLVDAAAETGCEYFVIDAGWYADGDWWDSVGEWKESRKRFPNGVREVTDYIRKKGMIPGVWLEPEVMGIYCSLAKEVPDDWFFMRHGKRVYDRSRFQLDYRNPKVREHMDEVVDRLVQEYGVGYFKMDYNIEPGFGTELGAKSEGMALLEHERSYLAWLDGIFDRYPDLVIENCSSGGLRMDYAMLSRCSIQSTSDQENYLNYAPIAANAPTGVTMEQAAVWSYPMNHEEEKTPEELREETIFNMINSMLLRIHQSGHLANVDEERRELVAEGIREYKGIRDSIKEAVPFWPLGLASFGDDVVSLGIRTEKKAYLSVWKVAEGRKEIKIPTEKIFEGKKVKEVSLLYPKSVGCDFCFDKEDLTISMKEMPMARMFEILPEE